jgi:ABC-type Na+ efflux pump permease subunit
MRNIFLIAHREFMATVATRAFIIGLFILPVIIALFALIGPRLFMSRNYRVQGEITVIDPTGRIISELQKTFDPVRIAAVRKEAAQKALAIAPQQVQQLLWD